MAFLCSLPRPTLTHEVAPTNWLKVNGEQFGSFYPQATHCGAVEATRTPSVVVQAIGRTYDSFPYRR
ncbi:MAG: hypothetical protein ACRYG7_45355 [Janthinobacterium lividum]